MPQHIFVPIVQLFVSLAGFSMGGLYMGNTYWREYKELSKVPIHERDKDHDQQITHTKGIATATMLASVAMLLIGTDICWILYNHFVLLLQAANK